MAQIKVKCPYCGSEKVIKHGKSDTGQQRYRCCNKDCETKTFRLEYIYTACNPNIEKQIIDMAANASGIRDTSRVLGISTYKVMDTLKKQKSK